MITSDKEKGRGITRLEETESCAVGGNETNVTPQAEGGGRGDAPMLMKTLEKRPLPARVEGSQNTPRLMEKPRRD